MKYYLYISDAKVDMLFPQVPHEIRKKVALEFKIDLKLFSASRKTESEAEDNRIARLEAVVKFIQEDASLGTVDEPAEYIQDTLPMKWGPQGGDPSSPLVLFEGRTEKTIAVLGGSMHHVLGNANSSASTSSSSTPALLHYLAASLRQSGEIAGQPMPAGGSPAPDAVRMAILATYNNQSGVPLQNLEFLAKRLIHSSGYVVQEAPPLPSGKRFINTNQFAALLCSPLYVAMTD